MSQAGNRYRLSRALLALLMLAGPWLSTRAQTAVQGIVHRGDVAIGYVAEHSLRVASGQNFWMNGGGIEAGTALWHGLGPAVNVTGTTTDHVGTNGVPLSLVTVTAGPRMRLREGSRISPYGEALFGLAHGFNSVFPGTPAQSASANSFALQVGAGADVYLKRRYFVRPLDISYVHTSLPNGSSNSQNTLRIGAGVGIVFGTH